MMRRRRVLDLMAQLLLLWICTEKVRAAFCTRIFIAPTPYKLYEAASIGNTVRAAAD